MLQAQMTYVPTLLHETSHLIFGDILRYPLLNYLVQRTMQLYGRGVASPLFNLYWMLQWRGHCMLLMYGAFHHFFAIKICSLSFLITALCGQIRLHPLLHS